MITTDAWRGGRFAVLGLARSGAATVRALLAGGATVLAWDDREEMRAAILPGTGRGASEAGGGAGGEFGPAGDVPLPHASHGSPSRSGEALVVADPLTVDLTGFDGVVVSPGVPLNKHPIAAHAAKAGVPVIGDIELFAQARAALPAHRVVGITGTNGKSTTTALVHHILRTAGIPTTMGGNIGLPILDQEPLPEGGVYVLELSSFQIDLTRGLDCDAAVLLNITPDHLDRYDSFEDYVASKERLFAMQSSEGFAIITADDAPTRAIAGRVFATRGGERDWRVFRGEEAMGQADWPALQGPHNAQNAMAAIATCEALGVGEAAILKGLQTYPGLPHRMERVREKDGVLFVNDSKATNPSSTAPALAAYPAVHWIVGGRAKSDELDACAPFFGHVRRAYTIGEASGLFARLLAPHMAVSESGDLTRAVSDAAGEAREGETVLLSPACASYDQFRDYEARGEAFRAAVEAL